MRLLRQVLHGPIDLRECSRKRTPGMRKLKAEIEVIRVSGRGLGWRLGIITGGVVRMWLGHAWAEDAGCGAANGYVFLCEYET